MFADGKGILASASTNGHIAFWDLGEGGRLLHLIRGAHDSAVSSIEWLPGQPVLLSSAGDNSIKVATFAMYNYLFEIDNVVILAMGMRFCYIPTTVTEISLWASSTSSLDSILWG